MKRSHFITGSTAALSLLSEPAWSANAREPAKTAIDPRILLGKEDWIFPGWESLTNPSLSDIDSSLDLLRKAHDLFAARNITLIYLIVPFKARMETRFLPSGSSLSTAVEQRYDHILARLASLELLTEDARPAGGVLLTKDQTAFYRTDQHWTGWNAEACAKIYADLLERRRLITQRSLKTRTLGDWTIDRMPGDLVQFLPNGLQKTIGVDAFTVRSPAIANDPAYIVKTSPLHVVGNSFVRPYLGFPNALANTLGCPVSLTTQRGDAGFWKIMLSYLESPEFSANPPRVVVWQLLESQLMSGPNAAGQWMFSSLMEPKTWIRRVKKALAA